MQTWELIVHGRVQGVGFRWHVLHCAKKHSVLGYVKNQPDGTVLVLAQANEDVLQLFTEEIQITSSRAVVQRVAVAKMDTTKSYNEFEIR